MDHGEGVKMSRKPDNTPPEHEREPYGDQEDAMSKGKRK